jgi:microcystin-dependent protein
MTSLLKTNAALTARTRPLTGDTKMTFVVDDHMGWLKCDGRSLDKTAYNLLFQVIGYTFGGSGSTFNLPNPQGRVMGTVGTVTDYDSRTRTYEAGDSVGELDHKLVQSEMPSHNHDINGAQSTDSPVTGNGNTSSYTHNHGGSTGQAGQAAESETVVGSVTAVVHSDAIVSGSGSHNHSISSDTHSHTIHSNGGDQYHNNVQPTLFYGNTFIYCGIPTMGYYPFTTGRAPVLI